MDERKERVRLRQLRTVKEYHEKVEYIHLNLVRAGRVGQPQNRRRSSFSVYTGMRPEESVSRRTL